MKLIVNEQDLVENIKQIDKYLERKLGPKYSFALDLVKKGVCFTL